MPVNKAWSRREYLGEHEIAQNLTLSSKTHSCKIESYSHRGDRTMDQGRKDLSFYRTVARFVRSLMGLLIIAAWPGLALAQGGETEVTKTTPSNPPPVVSAPAPVPPAPPAPAHVASKQPARWAEAEAPDGERKLRNRLSPRRSRKRQPRSRPPFRRATRRSLARSTTISIN